MRTGVEVVSITSGGITLKSGETIAAGTVIWCAGMRANPLTQLFPVERDRLGRLPVDSNLRVQGVPNVFAAGDSAWNQLDPQHVSVMSCQHARPMGRFAGHNVVADLLGLPMRALHIDYYVTILDLGPWGVYRRLIRLSPKAGGQKTKQTINCRRLSPLNRNRDEIPAAAAPGAACHPAA